MSVQIRTLLTFFMLWLSTKAGAQISGVVIDRETGDTIPKASLLYKGHHVVAAADEKGHFSIERHQ